MILRFFFVNAVFIGSLSLLGAEEPKSVEEQIIEIIGVSADATQREEIRAHIQAHSQLPSPQDFQLMMTATRRVLNEQKLSDFLVKRYSTLLNVNPIDYTILVGLSEAANGALHTEALLFKSPSSFRTISQATLRALASLSIRSAKEAILSVRKKPFDGRDHYFTMFREKVNKERIPPGVVYFRKAMGIAIPPAEIHTTRQRLKQLIESASISDEDLKWAKSLKGEKVYDDYRRLVEDKHKPSGVSKPCHKAVSEP